MTPMATRRIATATAPSTTDMVLTSVIISSLVASADSMVRLKLFNIGRSSKNTNKQLLYLHIIGTCSLVTVLLTVMVTPVATGSMVS